MLTRRITILSSTTIMLVTTVGAATTAVVIGPGDHQRSEAPPSSSAQLAVTRRILVERTLDGTGNNPERPEAGVAGTPYARMADPEYADGTAAMVNGPNARLISNRVFNDVGVNLFSQRNLSQWAWAWGQFIDHDIGLRDTGTGESAPIAFDVDDPLEEFVNDFGAVDFSRTPAAPGTGISTPREQINTISSFIDASNVYGNTEERLDWLRSGSDDGDPWNNRPRLMLPNGFLPRADERGDLSTAPEMELQGRLAGAPERAAVAGDMRANENIALTAIQTLFAREHNRIVADLPDRLSGAKKFAIARRVVGAEIQRITYEEFLPALGVRLSRYRGFDPSVDASLTNEFATVGFRAHSMVHGEFEMDFEAGQFTRRQLDRFRAMGIDVVDEDADHALTVPLTVAFGNPDLVESLGIDLLMSSLAGERQYKNDEQLDNSLRSVLFQVPRPNAPKPTACQTPVIDPACFSGVVDLGAIDIERARDHGIPRYNELRQAFGLPPKPTFTGVTGEPTAAFPTDPAIDPKNPINDPDIMDFVELRDADGNVLDPDDPDTLESAVTGVRRTTLAARLKAIYETTDAVDGFVGLVAEPHVQGTELGELQLAMMTQQFKALRDGDRFFYEGDPVLRRIARRFDVRPMGLAKVIAANTDTRVNRPFAAAG